jgi:uncharacterized membrane protein (UPF0182 family)
VILYYADRIGYGQTLADAFSDFAPGATTGHTVPGIATNATTTPPTSSSPPASSSSPPTSTPPPSTGRVTVEQIDQAVVELHDAYVTGNAAKIGAAQQQLYELVQRYNAQRSPSPAGSPTATSAASRGSG